MGKLGSSPSGTHCGRSKAADGRGLWSILLLCFTFVGHGRCWFYEGTDIIEVDEKVLNSRILKSDDEVWMVEWFHPGCGHCVAFKKTFIEAASLAKGSVFFGAIDCSKDFSLADQYGISSLPSMKFFGPNERAGEMYLGSHNAKDIADAAILYLKTNGTKQYEGTWKHSRAQLARARFTLHSWGISDMIISFTLVFSIGFFVLFRHRVVEYWPRVRRFLGKKHSFTRADWSSHCA